jgi:cell wall-associated NlpC family hydrolase
LKYSTEGPRNPDKGSADCSSTVNWAYQKTFNNNHPYGAAGGNTNPTTIGFYYNNDDFATVDMAKNVNPRAYNSSTGGPNLNNLQPGDVVLYSRNKDYTAGRAYRIGHVALYKGDGQVISHGADDGPRIVNLTGNNEYIMARRYVPFLTGAYNYNSAQEFIAEQAAKQQTSTTQIPESNATTSSNSNNTTSSSNLAGLEYLPSDIGSLSSTTEPVKPITGYTYGGTDTLPELPAGAGSGLVRYNIAQDGYNTIRRKHKSAKSVLGGSSGLVNLSKYTAARKAKYYMQTLNDMRGGDSGIGNEVLIPLIKGIISLLTNVSANSDQIKEAVVVLNKILEKTGTSPSINSTDMYATEKHIGADETDETIMEMQKLLQNLASGA